MSGIGMMILGSKGRINPINSTMTVGSQNYTFIKTTYYSDGWIGTGSSEIVYGAGYMGSMTAAGESVAIFWKSTGGHAGTGYVTIEIKGNLPAGYVTFISVNGTSLGSVAYASYNSTYNTTTFVTGTLANPFGTSGTKTIVVT